MFFIAIKFVFKILSKWKAKLRTVKQLSIGLFSEYTIYKENQRVFFKIIKS